MFQSLTPKPLSGLFATSLVLVQFLLPWLASCSYRPIETRQLVAAADIANIQLTKESLDGFTARLTGGSTDPQSVRPPADVAGKTLHTRLWMKYIVGSVVVHGSVNRCALSVMHGMWRDSKERYLQDLLEELNKKNDLGTVAHFIAEHTGEHHCDCDSGYLVTELVKSDLGTIRPLLEKILIVLRERDSKSKEYGAMVRCMPIELQYQRIDSGQVPLGEIERVYLFDKPFYSLLRELFFRARCSRDPNLEIREDIAELVPWFRQFIPEDIPSNAKNTCVVGSVDPGHDVWNHVRSFMDVETLILVWPSVCRAWNKSYPKMLAEDTRIQEWFLQDLNHVYWSKIHTIAPWKYFLNGNNSALYLGQCILNGALGRTKLDKRSAWEIEEYLCNVASGKASIPQASKKDALYGHFARLIEEGYKAYPYKMPALSKPPILSDEEYERAIHYLVCQRKLVIRLSCQWIIDNVSRIYLILGEDQGLIRKVIELSIGSHIEILLLWIMIGQACGITEETARLVFGNPGIFIKKLIRPVVVKPSEYYNFIADSGILFEMTKVYYEYTWNARTMYQFNCLIISLVLSFKYRPDKIDKIVASMTSQLPTLRKGILRSMQDHFGTGALNILKRCDKYPPEDVAFVEGVLKRCGLL